MQPINIIAIESLLAYIDAHLYEPLDLDALSRHAGYSKYHLHRLFASVVGMTPHMYIVKRKLHAAAQGLSGTTTRIDIIACRVGYDSIQGFYKAFRKQYGTSPDRFRKRGMQPPDWPAASFIMAIGQKEDTMDYRIGQMDGMRLIGYAANTRYGFMEIGKAWRRLQKNRDMLHSLGAAPGLVGLNDYSNYMEEQGQKGFLHFAGAMVPTSAPLPKGMQEHSIPASHYAIFSFRGRAKDSMEPYFEHIYKEWLPQSSERLRETARYDFALYGDAVDAQGMSDISLYIPIESAQ